jgi:hypothetical protein
MKINRVTAISMLAGLGINEKDLVNREYSQIDRLVNNSSARSGGDIDLDEFQSMIRNSIQGKKNNRQENMAKLAVIFARQAARDSVDEDKEYRGMVH